MGFDIVGPEFIDRPSDGMVLLTQILRGEHFFGREVFDKKCPTAYLGRRCCRCCHRSTPVPTRLHPYEGSCGMTCGAIVEAMGPHIRHPQNCVSLYHLLVDNVKSKERESSPANLASSVPVAAWCSVCNRRRNVRVTDHAAVRDIGPRTSSGDK